VRIIAVSSLREFWQRHPTSESSLRAWVRETIRADWTQPADVKKTFRTASIVGNQRLVFKIKGNSFRLVVGIAYRSQIVFVKFIGTHAEYDTVDALTVDPFDSEN